VDLDELSRESDEVVGSDVAEAAMDELREINRGRARRMLLRTKPS